MNKDHKCYFWVDYLKDGAVLSLERDRDKEFCILINNMFDVQGCDKCLDFIPINNSFYIKATYEDDIYWCSTCYLPDLNKFIHEKGFEI